MELISFQCYACGKQFKVGADKAGKKAKCGCGTVLTVPVQSTVATQVSGGASTRVGNDSGAARPPAPPPLPAAAPKPTTRTGSAAPPLPAGRTKNNPAPPAHAEYVADTDYGGKTSSADDFAADFGDPAPRARGRADDDFDDAGDAGRQPARRGGEAAAWGWAGIGTLIVFIASCVTALSFLLELIGWLLVSIPVFKMLAGGMPTGGGDTGRTLLGVSAILWSVAMAGGIAGYVFCMLGPNKRGTFGMSIAAISVTGVNLLLTLILLVPFFFSQSMGFFGGGITGYLIGFMFIQILYGGEAVLYPMVVRSWAAALKNKALAGTSMTMIILVSIYVGERLLTLLLQMIAMNAQSGGPTGGRVFGWIIMFLLWIGLLGYCAYIVFYILYNWAVYGMTGRAARKAG